ncbi:MAG: peptidase S53 [Nitrososphaerota archaeon]|jgi:subtilase family serine protease|nr:peptidase S53 [Nitrososphaerota archaeon]MDG6936523.1 peptidase S53 [Nitrososphaerota archaeon]MDG6944998.1 peptidase S53 [Nitrososphaerota archaeon]
MKNILLLLLVLSLAVPVSGAASAAPSSYQSAITQLPGYKNVGVYSSQQPLLVTVMIPLRNTGLLYSTVQQISSPSSPSYRHFLTQSAVKSTFYPVNRFNSVEDYLVSKGMKIVYTALDSVIVVSATPAQIRDDLGLSVYTFSNGSLSYYAGEGTPSLSGAYVYVSNITSILLHSPPDMVTSSMLESFMKNTMQPNQTSPIQGISAVDLRSAYNASTLIASGYSGKGYSIGILDFYGDPYISQQLAAFDRQYGLPAANFSVVPVGQYDPNLGIATGWAEEISGDVELAHAMAPEANITLYVANGALPIGAVIAQIVQQNEVNDLSQSFSIPESDISLLGPAGFASNIVMADQYYALGSAEGITFIASTGDAGGSGYSAGPEGTPGYPSTSPFVTAAGGTSVYISGNSTYQTAWSNYGFVPLEVNYGGSTGGVSTLEPLPWYQANLSVPSSYPDGRMVPDISLDANAYPGTYVVMPGNETAIFGGTSEASPLFAGLLADVMQYTGSSLGLINPALYEDPNATTPVTFGYNIPWVAGDGYNLVTGLGAPNIGNLASYIESVEPTSGLGVTVNAYNSSFATPQYSEFLQGQEMIVTANITYNGKELTNGSFTSEINTLQGTAAKLAMQYNSTMNLWLAVTAFPQAQGMSYIFVNGSSEGLRGNGFTDVFAGYFADYMFPEPVYPESPQEGVPVVAYISTLNGSPAPVQSFSVVPELYSIRNNSYSQAQPFALIYDPYSGAWEGTFEGNYSGSPVTLVTQGAYGYLEFMDGVDLQNFFILPQTVVEPGAVGPGQSIFIEGYPIAPLNLPPALSSNTGYNVPINVEIGSNVTATLLNPGGVPVAEATVPMSETLGYYYGTLTVPENATPGLYTVILNSTYNSITLGTTINGSFFGQIYVAPSSSVPRISVVRQAYEGQYLNIYANITYINGTEVKYGMYTASVYSSDEQANYGSFSAYGYPQAMLSYNSNDSLWTGQVRLPTPYSPFQYNISTGSVLIGTQGYSGPYDVYVSGISADGVPTTAQLSAQQQFYINPMLLIQDSSLVNPGQASQVAFMNDNITASQLANDEFIGSNRITGSSNISYSTVAGTLYITNSNAIIRSTSGSSIVAINSSLTLIDSGFSSVSLLGSHITLVSSNITSITPSLPSIKIINPVSNVTYSTTVPVQINVTGSDISAVHVYVDGELLGSQQVISTSGGTISLSLNAASYPDGTHTITVKAVQGDGLVSQASARFDTTYQLATVKAGLMGMIYVAMGIAAVGLVVAVVALRRRS